MKKFYKSDRIIINRKNIYEIIIRDSYDKKYYLDICNPDGDIRYRLKFETKAEAEAELNSIYEAIAPQYDKTIVALVMSVSALALATYTFWYPLLNRLVY